MSKREIKPVNLDVEVRVLTDMTLKELRKYIKTEGLKNSCNMRQPDNSYRSVTFEVKEIQKILKGQQ